jgi:hypothetical protein
MLFKEIVAVYRKNYTENINNSCEQDAEFIRPEQLVRIVNEAIRVIGR